MDPQDAAGPGRAGIIGQAHLLAAGLAAAGRRGWRRGLERDCGPGSSRAGEALGRDLRIVRGEVRVGAREAGRDLAPGSERRRGVDPERGRLGVVARSPGRCAGSAMQASHRRPTTTRPAICRRWSAEKAPLFSPLWL